MNYGAPCTQFCIPARLGGGAASMEQVHTGHVSKRQADGARAAGGGRGGEAEEGEEEKEEQTASARKDGGGLWYGSTSQNQAELWHSCACMCSEDFLCMYQAAPGRAASDLQGRLLRRAVELKVAVSKLRHVL